MATARASSKPTYDEWMTNLPAKLHSKPLNSLAIPGSHDSFAFYLNKNDDVAPNLEGSCFQNALLQAKLSKDLIWNWSKTQSLTFEEQLESGIRYFDLRLACRDDSEKFYFVHGLYGLKLKEAFRVFNSFLKNHNKEVIFLHFQHFYDFKKSNHKELQELICDKFNSRLCPKSKDAKNITLGSLWQNDHQVIALYNDDIEQDYEDLLWPGKRIQTPWPNVTSADKLIEELDKNCGEERDDTQFHVSQGVLTPDAPLILKNLDSTLKEECAKKAAGPVVKWISKKTPGDRGINICILDYVEMSKFIPTVINLNVPKESLLFKGNP